MKARAAAFALLCGFCVWLYWPGLTAWFSMDDFAWLSLRLRVAAWGDLPSALFSPMAQGTIRPLSERIYFLGLSGLFGVEALPFRILAFATQLLNLWLVLRLVERVTGSRWGGVAAALLWLVNSSLARAMSWSSAYNQILWPCFLLAACHARWSWLESGDRRARVREWIFFLLGFGVLELQVVYPVMAAGLTLLYHRERWRDLPPLFAVAGAYALFNRSIAKAAATPVYTLYWDSSMAATFATYARMATGLWRPELFRESESWWLAAEWVAGLGLALGIGWLLWKREKWMLFGLLWFGAALAPVLPLKNHITGYYMTVPSLGLAMAAGVALARKPVWMLLPVTVYAAGSGYQTRMETEYYHERGEQGRVIFRGVREAARRHPGKIILLTAVSSDQFWGVLNDYPFRLLPGVEVYLAPDAEEGIEKHPDLGNPADHVLPGPAALAALERDAAIVYSTGGGKLRDVTAIWKDMAAERWKDAMAPVVELGLPLMQEQLDGGWHGIEQGFRWSSGKSAVRLQVPAGMRELVLNGFRGEENGQRGAVTVVATVNGRGAGQWTVESDESVLEVAAPLPEGLDRTKPVRVEVTVSPVIREGGTDGRELGLAFVKIGVR